MASDVPQGFRILGLLGAGRRCTAWRARWAGREIVLKRYTEDAAAKHARRSPIPLARYEFERNLRLFQLPGIAGNIAEPLHYEARGRRQLFLQELVAGTPLAGGSAGLLGPARRHVLGELRRILAVAHAAALYDLDLHPGNVMLAPGPGPLPRVVLFDFNKIPFHEWPPNPLSAALLALGLLGRESRDRRLLRRLRLGLDSRQDLPAGPA